jgi:hypothetical protein
LTLKGETEMNGTRTSTATVHKLYSEHPDDLIVFVSRRKAGDPDPVTGKITREVNIRYYCPLAWTNCEGGYQKHFNIDLRLVPDQRVFKVDADAWYSVETARDIWNSLTEEFPAEEGRPTFRRWWADPTKDSLPRKITIPE